MAAQIRVLHITPHLGGGVGRVLRQLTSASAAQGRFAHEIACLDYANDSSLSWARQTATPIHSETAGNKPLLSQRMREADIVQIHWWNHPLLYELLEAEDLPPSRCAIWAHVNGFYAPHQFLDPVLDYADVFVLGTPQSRRVPAIAARCARWTAASLRTVFASAGYEHVDHVRRCPHEGYRVGYIGTVDYCKMHSAYLQMHAAAEIPAVTYVVCGGSRHEPLRRAAEEMGVARRFDIRGHVSNVAEVLASLDVFGYPLQRRHYGASEMALVEALVAGVVPVVLNNGCETEIVRDGKTGIVAAGPIEYTRALEFLYRHPDARLRMSRAAATDARERFPISRTVAGWHAIYEELVDSPLCWRSLRWAAEDTSGEHGAAARFLRSLGNSVEGRLFRSALDSETSRSCLEPLARLDPIFRGSSNGSVFQYQRFFPADTQLRHLCDLVSRAERLLPARTPAGLPAVFPATLSDEDATCQAEAVS
jgi:glycosyltransferase involved in cell wall biosynthesis